MTACCRAMIEHAFETWNLNRVTIECATGNARSRAIPERLGFKLEGIAREVEWLHDHFVDHAIYGQLKSDYIRDLLGEIKEYSAGERNNALPLLARHRERVGADL